MDFPGAGVDGPVFALAATIPEVFARAGMFAGAGGVSASIVAKVGWRSMRLTRRAGWAGCGRKRTAYRQ